MKNFKLILLTCFCLFLFTVSCDKEILETKPSSTSVVQARANAAAKARKDIDKAFLNYDFSKYKIIPLWDLAVVAKNKKSVEVPYVIDGKMIIPGVSKLIKGRQRLLLTLEKSKVSVMVVQYLPSSEFKGNIREIYAENFAQNKFNGKVVFQTLGIDKQYIWILKNGKVEGKKTGKVISKKNLRPNGWEQRCEMISYWIEIGTYENGEYIFLGGYTEEREECTSVWVPDGGDDNGGGDDPTDCNMHPELPWCDNGEGGGGGDPCGNSNGRSYPCDFGSDASTPGTKPIAEYVNDKCGGAVGMWNMGLQNNNHEVYGVLTQDGSVLITQISPNFTGGNFDGLYSSNGSVYYYYYSINNPMPSYTGTIHNTGLDLYFIPIKATIHTHTPCVNDGTDGITGRNGQDDFPFAANPKYSVINHFVIGCNGGTGQYDGTHYFNHQMGGHSNTCNIIN